MNNGTYQAEFDAREINDKIIQTMSKTKLMKMIEAEKTYYGNCDEVHYILTPKSFQAIIDEVCKNQRIGCNIKYNRINDKSKINLLTTKQPETGIKL